MTLTPFEWLELVRDASVEILSETEAGTPSKVEIGDMKSVVGTLDECDSGLFVDGGAWYETNSERWPDRLQLTQLTAAIRGCAPTMAFPISVRYYHCVPVIEAGGAAPSQSKRYASADLLWDTGHALWEGLGCRLKPWKRQYGTVVRTDFTPYGRQGGFSGFEVKLLARLANCEDCDAGS